MLEYNENTGEIFATGCVGDYFEEGFDAGMVRGAFRAMNGRDIKFNIQSVGGDVYQGISIVNQVRAYKGKVTAIVDAMAASIASVIAVSADETHIYEGSQMMLHNAWTIELGDAADFRRTAETLDSVDRDIAGIYARKSGKTEDEMLAIMEKDKHWRAEELLEMGLVDGIIRPNEKRVTASLATQSVASAAAFPRAIAAKHRLREMRTRCR